GVTWEKILTKVHDPTGVLSGSIGHFHTCKYNKYADAWFVTTGDWDIQLQWLVSTDEGNSWRRVDSTASQLFRTITPQITSSNKIIWGTDNGNSVSGIFSIDWDSLFNYPMPITQLCPLKGVEVYNLIVYNNQILFTERADSGTTFLPAIYYSGMGSSWQKVMEWPRLNDKQAGFQQGCGVDDSGRVFISLSTNLDNYPNILGISFTFPFVQETTYIAQNQLTVFTGSVDMNKVILKWTITSENNIYGYRVERRSNNSAWEEIGFVKGSGSTVSAADYKFIDNLENVTFDGQVEYRFKQVGYDGLYSLSNILSINAGAIIKEFTLYQNYPNPFNPGTKIIYSLPRESKVILKIYDSAGKEVKVLENGNKAAGRYSVYFDGSRYSSGIYLISLQAGKYSAAEKMALIK
ncbi:MAG: T9SS type A sorting domain-containing protein, partial [Ignavibacteriaceae bacterium]|nr:T9SS type A sorting domain-containing protein [Ignavibacteriaceae bacterium]